jgi:RNA polymerase sigma-70 factor, ECF subfamily
MMQATELRMDTDETSLVEAAKNGHVDAFERLVESYDRRVFRIAQHITHSREDAEDIVQDVFLKAFHSLARTCSGDI